MRLLKPAFASFVRNKKLLLYISNIAIIIGLIMVIFGYKIVVEKIYKNEIENNIKNRTIFISSKDTEVINFNDIMNIEDIEKSQYIFNPLTVKINDVFFNIKNDILLDESKIIYGRNCEDDKIEMVIPDSLENAVDLLGTSVVIQYKDLIIKAEIVGIYNDITKQSYGYSSTKFMQNIVQYDQEIINTSACLAVINKYENLENVMQQLKNKNYSSNLYDTSALNDIKTYRSVDSIFNVLIGIMTLLIYIILSMIITNIINSGKKDIAILKAIGYKQLDIFKIIFYRIFLITIISFTFAIIIHKTLGILLEYKIIKIANLKLSYNLNLEFIYYIIILLVLIFMVIIISLKNVKKIKQIDTIILLKE